jgi:hypothetical protein
MKLCWNMTAASLFPSFPERCLRRIHSRAARSLLLIALPACCSAADLPPPARDANAPAPTNRANPTKPTPSAVAADLDARLAALQRVLSEASKLRDSSPEEYVRADQDYLESCEAFTANHPAEMERHYECKNLAPHYRSLANFVRFRLHQPAHAITLYARLEAMAPGNGWPGIADTYEFDLHDKAQAIAAYRHIVSQLEAAPERMSGEDVSLSPLLLTAYRQEIDYLTTGRRYSGKPTRDQQQACALWIKTGGGGYIDAIPFQPAWRAASTRRGPPDYDAAFREFPASLQLMHATFLYAAFVRNPATLTAYYKRSDPAGFWTSCAFAMVNNVVAQAEAAQRSGAKMPESARQSEPESPTGMPRSSSAVAAAAKAYGQEHPNVAAEPVNPNLASPAATWQYMLKSLRAGDAKAALECYTGALRESLAPLFRGRSRDELRKIADSFVAFEPGEDMGPFNEATVVRATPTGNQVGMVTFSNQGGRWLIESM